MTRSNTKPSLDPNVVAVAPFDVHDAELGLWREGLADILARNLDGAGALRSVPPTVVVRRWTGRADAASARILGTRTGAGLVLYGALTRAGRDSVRLRAAFLDVASDRTLPEIDLRDDAEHIDRLADSAAVWLLRELGRSRPVGAARLTSIGSRSIPALKAFCGEQLYAGLQRFARKEYDRASRGRHRLPSTDGETIGWHGRSDSLKWSTAACRCVPHGWRAATAVLSRLDHAAAAAPTDTPLGALRVHARLLNLAARDSLEPQIWY